MTTDRDRLMVLMTEVALIIQGMNDHMMSVGLAMILKRLEYVSGDFNEPDSREAIRKTIEAWHKTGTGLLLMGIGNPDGDGHSVRFDCLGGATVRATSKEAAVSEVKAALVPIINRYRRTEGKMPASVTWPEIDAYREAPDEWMVIVHISADDLRRRAPVRT